VVLPKKTFIPIGTYGTFTPDQARTKAKEYLRRLDNGENPHPKAQPKRGMITIQDLYRQYISGKKTPLAASSLYHYTGTTKTFENKYALTNGILANNDLKPDAWRGGGLDLNRKYVSF
jgi:hypothetical protein